MPRTCKVCKTKFEPQFNSVQPTCGYKCAIEYAKNLREKKEKKEWKARKKVLKEKVKTKSDYLKELQAVFNTFIRLSKEPNCISCGLDLRGRKYDAGHFRSVGNCPALRFEEVNVWPQCVHCNQYRSGNILNYRKRLVELIGLEEVDRLESKQEPKQYSIPELILMKEDYKERIRKLKNN